MMLVQSVSAAFTERLWRAMTPLLASGLTPTCPKVQGKSLPGRPASRSPLTAVRSPVEPAQCYQEPAGTFRAYSLLLQGAAT